MTTNNRTAVTKGAQDQARTRYDVRAHGEHK